MRDLRDGIPPGVRKLLRGAEECQKELSSLLEKSDVFVPRAAVLREKLKQNYLKLVKLNQRATHHSDVGRNLWRTVFYGPIERLRCQQRKYDEAAAAGNESVARDRDRHREIFTSFLKNAERFYVEVIRGVQQKYGSVGIILPGEDWKKTPHKGPKVLPRTMDPCCFTCYESLIFLGDVLRYAQTQLKPSSKWSFALSTACYRQAAYLCPQSGNPHNQLCVIFQYTREDLRAVYHNYRALFSEAPFPTIKDNFKLLFERVKRSRRSARGASTPGAEPGFSAYSCVTHLLSASAELFSGVPGDTTSALGDHCDNFLQQFSQFCLLSPEDQKRRLATPNPRQVKDVHVVYFFIKVAVLCMCNVHISMQDRLSAKVSAEGSGNTKEFVSRYLMVVASVQFQILNYCRRIGGLDSLGLPAINIFTSWLDSNKDILVHLKGTENEQLRAEHKNFVDGLASFLRDNDYFGAHDAFVEKSAKYGLLEDVELRGFTPILKSQDEIKYEVWQVAQRPGRWWDIHRKQQRIARIMKHLTNLTGENFEPPAARCLKRSRVNKFTPAPEGTFPELPVVGDARGRATVGAGHHLPPEGPLSELPVFDLLCRAAKPADQEYLEKFWHGAQFVVQSRAEGRGSRVDHQAQPPRKRGRNP
ncbi:Est1 DNA/RNA binding domain-containing protein [Chloropicon primus]|uniref:Telomerase activating protein Est1-like N-terminal domain-containing protein n=1 Tax=Chloropicon primus TaxID=1764295 RepID=A0A5B8ML77_9CHLO|nr:hypothetical protein A3770_05p37310 [Chloropicon primus]UPR00427.1 Est1 DNA/RNA binding domain-containing protein [Chloropicon primus]|mmetsp:Transcript_957/g.2846  ORF Transcript_957/g.2846 Transcript_957/m.2846 type:complete len:644 (+) Transcript_957:153-2084(+)|eukprot:QDZ21213.1 hypothetical protein A3770_05p37310 [Chloropicon primus]